MRPPHFFLLWLVAVSATLSGCQHAPATQRPVNYDEAKAGAPSLPDPLACENGTRVESPEQWWSKRRPELLSLFETEVYGRTPKDPVSMQATVTSIHESLAGKALMKQIRLELASARGRLTAHLLLVLPKAARGPVPCFLGLNFLGNLSVSTDPAIATTDAWMPDDPSTVDHRATERTRGVRAHRWPLEMIVERGYGVATAYLGDFDPDFDDGFQNGVHPLFYRTGQTRPAAEEWGTVGAWAWGLSRALDYLETDGAVDAKRVVVFGHSRLGKAALWAAAQDSRFAMAVSNNSGCGGAALFKRDFGESVRTMNETFPHWFSASFRKYADREDRLPVDQHELLALVAPRPVYVASASEDRWADPRGEFLAAAAAGPVYELLGARALPVREMPAVGVPVSGTIGYHVRSGKHGLYDEDWRRFLDFADAQLRR